jgi:hypothetical protein
MVMKRGVLATMSNKQTMTMATMMVSIATIKKVGQKGMGSLEN